MEAKAKRNVRLLIAGRTVSLMGTGIYNIALPLYILKLTASLSSMGLYYGVASLPSILLSPVIGVYVEKWSRKHNLILSDVVSGFIYLILTAFYAAGQLKLPLLLTFTVIMNIINVNFNVASSVIFSEITPHSILENMNGVKSICDNIAFLISPVVGTLLFGTFGMGAVLVVNMISYFISAAEEYFISYELKNTKKTVSRQSFLKELQGGFKIIKDDSVVRGVFIIAMALNFFVSPTEEIFSPGMLIRKYGIDESLYGLTSTAAAVGTIVASFYVARNKKTDLFSRMNPMFIADSAVMVMAGMLSLALFGINKNIFFILYISAMAATAAITTLVNIPIFSTFQKRIPIEYQGRFFSIQSLFSGLLIPLGIAWAGFLSQRLGADTVCILNNATVIAIVIVRMMLKHR